MDLHGFQRQYAHLLTPTCTITHIHSGEVAQGQASLQHDIPAMASARIDVQLVPGQDPDDIFSKIRHHLDTQGFSDINMQMVYAQAPVKTSLQNPFVQHMQQATRTTYGREAIILPLIQGTNPFWDVALAQAPTVIFATGYGEKEEYPQPQQFLMVVMQLALLLERIQDLQP
jgi:acetylornithine deacetylase/succinyl-diaminopimelate desuccinylase-like protein